MLNRDKDCISVPRLPANSTSLPFVGLVSLEGVVYTLYIVPSGGIIYMSSHLQAYLQQVQDLVILESIILQTLGKFIFL